MALILGGSITAWRPYQAFDGEAAHAPAKNALIVYLDVSIDLPRAGIMRVSTSFTIVMKTVPLVFLSIVGVAHADPVKSHSAKAIDVYLEQSDSNPAKLIQSFTTQQLATNTCDDRGFSASLGKLTVDVAVDRMVTRNHKFRDRRGVRIDGLVAHGHDDSAVDLARQWDGKPFIKSLKIKGLGAKPYRLNRQAIGFWRYLGANHDGCSMAAYVDEGKRVLFVNIAVGDGAGAEVGTLIWTRDGFQGLYSQSAGVGLDSTGNYFGAKGAYAVDVRDTD